MKIKVFALLFLLLVVFFSGCSRLGSSNVTDPSFFTHHTVIRVSDQPLFSANGHVNADVLDSLMTILADPSLDPLLRQSKVEWTTGLDFEGVPYTAITTADFSNFVVGSEGCISHSGAIIIKLFETMPNRYGAENGHLTELTSQWWQLVYRSTDDGGDVLTLWMVEPYRLSYFAGNRFEMVNLNNGERRHDERFALFPEQVWRFIPANDINTIRADEQIANGLPASSEFFFEGNYSMSIARANLLRDMEFLLSQFDISQFLVAPKDVPSNWQSSYYQTGTNAFMEFYVSGEFLTAFEDYEGSVDYQKGLGAAGKIWGHHANFNILNGKDGLSIGPYNNHFPHTNIHPTYYDLLWLPSDFEVRSMGHDKDIATLQTFIADPRDPESILRWNYIGTRENDWRYGHDQSGGRSGLWQLNGFDRAFNFGLPSSTWDDGNEFWINNLVWLRSIESFTIGNANVVSYTGNRYGYGVNQQAGLRPALHLSISELLRGN